MVAVIAYRRLRLMIAAIAYRRLYSLHVFDTFIFRAKICTLAEALWVERRQTNMK